jgi:glycosyltransferase involved in cell wall biosynthesis
MKLNSLIYLSTGNLPSKMAHSIQIAKMAQSFSKKIENFELITSGDIRSFMKGMDSEFRNWYGLNCSFKVVRLPLHFRVKYPFDKNYKRRGFFKSAVSYACLKSPSVLYTRSPEFVDLLLKIGLPIVWEWHEPINNKSPHQKFLRDKNLIGMVTTLPQLSDSYIQHGLASEKVLVVPNAVDVSNLMPYQPKELARQKLSLSKDAKILLYSGHLYDYKGIPTILETAKLMPSYEFILVGGWAEDINKVKESCRQQQLNNVRLIGYVEQTELASYLYAADVCLLPTSKSWNLANATCPLKLFDYMATKKPVVASALPTIATVLRDRENGLLVEPDNPLGFKEAIKTLFDNPNMANEMAETGFQDVQHLTWDNRADQVLQFVADRLRGIEENSIDYKTALVKLVLGKY